MSTNGLQLSYGNQAARGLLAGMLADSGPTDIDSLVNKDPQAVQVDDWTVAAYVAGKVYTFQVDGVAFSYTATVADANETGVAASIATQVNADPLLSGRILATSLVAALTFTGRVAGVGWTAVATHANLTLVHTTAVGVAAEITFGLGVLENGQATTGLTSLKYGRLAKGTNLTAKAVKLTPTIGGAASTGFYVNVKVKGVLYEGSYLGDGTATVKEVVEGLTADLNAKLPTQTVIVTEDDLSLTLTSELAGLSFEYGHGTNDATNTWAVTSDTALISDDVNAKLAGVAVHTYDVERNASGVAAYPGGSVMSVIKRGRVVVNTEDAVTLGTSKAFIRLADTAVTGNPLGGFRATAATDCVELTGWRWAERKSATQAVLERV
jgi:hypothetical protein